MLLIEILKAIFIGIVEGLTEFLPVSSTGHIIIAEQFAPLNNAAFRSMFMYVIQLGAILAVVVLYWDKLWPFSPQKSVADKKRIWRLWFKVAAAVLPSVIIGLKLNDWMDAHLMTPVVVATMLIVYGIAFILIERHNDKKPQPLIQQDTDVELDQMSYKTALGIGFFQVLSIVPGTSRSGATILGGLMLGTSRQAAADFSFFLAIPTMVGVSILKIGSFLAKGNSFTFDQSVILFTGTLTSFIVALFAIKFMLQYIQKHSFAVFGWYRIVVGLIVLALAYFGVFN
jgi:undecaprenyl-diphosphatase